MPLTDQEIRIDVCFGFIPICIGRWGSREGDRSLVLVDSIEVYAEDRDKLFHLFPIIKQRQDLPTPNRRPFLQENNVGTNPNLSGIVIISHALVKRVVPRLKIGRFFLVHTGTYLEYSLASSKVTW